MYSLMGRLALSAIYPLFVGVISENAYLNVGILRFCHLEFDKEVVGVKVPGIGGGELSLMDLA